MGFVVRLPRTLSGNNAVWVIVDRLTNIIHFILVTTTNCLEKLTELYVKEILKLHHLPRNISIGSGSKIYITFLEKPTSGDGH